MSLAASPGTTATRRCGHGALGGEACLTSALLTSAKYDTGMTSAAEEDAFYSSRTSLHAPRAEEYACDGVV
eukprot:scaffold11281_cov36-Phaeocystis_antarctica.AAC.2